VGELKKLGHTVSASAARGVLVARDLPPTAKKSGRHLPMAWTNFVRANVDSLVATDFFTQPVHTLTGTVHAYVLVFIHLRTRRVFASPATLHPNEAWMQQQARNASAWIEDEGLQVKWLIHDRDTKYSRKFRGFWTDSGIRPLQTPRRAPRANSYVESFLGTLKRECLDYFFCLSMRQVDYVVKTWLAHYHSVRPHQGLGNNVLAVDFTPQTEGEVKCRERLGGVVREYYRKAA
jgi:putative transposase